MMMPVRETVMNMPASMSVHRETGVQELQLP